MTQTGDVGLGVMKKLIGRRTTTANSRRQQKIVSSRDTGAMNLQTGRLPELERERALSVFLSLCLYVCLFVAVYLG